MIFHCRLFGHAHTRRDRDEDGRLQLVCERCDQPIKLFDQPAIRGPQAIQAQVEGQPTGRAKKENVKPFTRLEPSSASRLRG